MEQRLGFVDAHERWMDSVYVEFLESCRIEFAKEVPAFVIELMSLSIHQYCIHGGQLARYPPSKNTHTNTLFSGLIAHYLEQMLVFVDVDERWMDWIFVEFLQCCKIGFFLSIFLHS